MKTASTGVLAQVKRQRSVEDLMQDTHLMKNGVNSCIAQEDKQGITREAATTSWPLPFDGGGRMTVHSQGRLPVPVA